MVITQHTPQGERNFLTFGPLYKLARGLHMKGSDGCCDASVALALGAASAGWDPARAGARRSWAPPPRSLAAQQRDGTSRGSIVAV